MLRPKLKPRALADAYASIQTSDDVVYRLQSINGEDRRADKRSAIRHLYYHRHGPVQRTKSDGMRLAFPLYLLVLLASILNGTAEIALPHAVFMNTFIAAYIGKTK